MTRAVDNGYTVSLGVAPRLAFDNPQSIFLLLNNLQYLANAPLDNFASLPEYLELE